MENEKSKKVSVTCRVIKNAEGSMNSQALDGTHTGMKAESAFKCDNAQYADNAPASNNEDFRDNEPAIIDQNVMDNYNLLKEQFDRVVYIVSEMLSIQGNSAFWKTALHQYVSSEAYCYPWLTEANLPYIFCYRGMQHCNIIGLKFKKDCDIYNILATRKDVSFREPNEDGYCKSGHASGCSTDLHFRFIGHQQNEQNLHEYMDIYIDDYNDMSTPLYHNTVDFDESYLANLMKKGKYYHREAWLLSIAREEMPPLHI